MDGRLVVEALTAARRVLHDLEPSEIPPRLRRIAGSSARRLPVPLERTLLAALDEYAWLRTKALDELAEGSGEVSRAFLERSDGWEASLAEAAALAVADDEDRMIERLVRDVEAVTAQRDQARDKVKALQVMLDSERADHRATASRVKDDKKPEVRVPAEIARRIDELESAHRTMSERLAERERRLEKTRADLLKARRVGPAGETAGTSGFSVEPIALARQLDRMMAAARPDAVPGAVALSVSGASVDDLALPVGVAPDSAAAIRYLIARKAPTWVIVDGYNLAYHLDPVGFSTPTSRARVTAGLSGLKSRAVGAIRITVVWDSAEEPTEGPAAPGVERRFVADADEEVRQLSKQGRGSTVVISTDREIHSGVAPGTLVLWSEAFADWYRTR